MRNPYRHVAPILCLVVLLLCSLAAVAQGVTGSISGTVTDSNGASVSNATVTFTRTDINQVIRTVKTSSSGSYSAPNLPLGNYSISISAPSFSEQVLTGIVLHVSDTLTVDSTLKVSGSETVSVSTAQQQINLENSTSQSLVDGTQMRELVMSNRNYEQLVGLQPGVAYTGADQLYIGNSNPTGGNNLVSYSINGARTSGNAWLVDGADNQDRGSNYTLLTYPSVDAIAEFKTMRNSYSAEYGRSANGQVNVITKSGTNQIHGTVYEFVRNDIFNANDTLNKLTTTPNGGVKTTAPRSLLRYNDFGYTFGGPVYIPHFYDGRKHGTHFFFSQELRRTITYSPITLSYVPSKAMRSGNFTVPVCPSPDPNTGLCTTALTTTISNISAPAAAYLKDIYAKVGEPDSSGTLVLAPQRNVYNGNQQIVRIDQQLGQKLNVFFRFIHDSIPTIEPNGLFQSNSYPGVQTTSTNAPGKIYLGHFTYAASPSLLIDGGYAYSWGALLSDPIGTALNANSPDVKPTIQLPFTSTLDRVPALSWQYGVGVTTYGPYRDYNRNHNVFANVIKTHGSHTFKTGFSYNHYNKRENNAGANAGSFYFSGTGVPTTSSANTLFQQSFANFLTGYVTTFTQASTDVTPDIRANQFEAYVQDDWKATPRLTLNMGIRYSKFAQPTDANHQLTTFDPSLYNAALAPTIDKSSSGLLCVTGAPCTGGVTPNPNANLLNGMSINGSTSPYGDKIGKSDNLNFAPRVGFALDVFGNGKTALRGGFGIAFDSALFGTYEQNIFQNKPYVNTPSIANTSFANPGGVAASANYSAYLVRATTPKFRTPYTEQYSLDIQQSVGKGVVADIAYVGNTQVHLLGLVDINQPTPGAFATANLSTTGNVSTITSSNVGYLNQIRPYRGYSSINSVQTIFGGNYNALQASINKHWAHETMLQGNYTWSRALTNAAADRSGAPQISSNPAAEYGRAAADRTHMFNFNGIYSLPWFYDQKGVVGHLLGGWVVSGLGYFNSGLPLNVTTSGLDPAGVGVVYSSSVSGGRPDRVGDPNKSSASVQIHTRQRWYNPFVFQGVPAGQYRGGNAQRNSVNGPGWWRVDAGVFRNIKFYDRLHLQLRAEAFNLFNHTNPDTVTTSGIVTVAGAAPAATTTAGNITGYRTKRIMQFGAKIVF